MAEIPANLPWIPSFNTWLDAMHSGAGLGIQRAHLAQQAAETAARLHMQQQQEDATRREFAEKQRLGWAQLSVDRESSLARLQLTAAQHEHAMELKQSQLQSLDAYRRLEAQTAQDRLDLTRTHGAESDYWRGQALDVRRQALEGQNDRAAAILKARTDYQSKVDQRQRLEYQITQLEREQAGDLLGAQMVGQPEPPDKKSRAWATWKKANDRATAIKSLTDQLHSGFSDVGSGFGGGGGGAFSGAGAATGRPAYVMDPKTGKPVLATGGGTSTATAPAGASASWLPGQGAPAPGSSSFLNSISGGPGVPTPSSYLTGAATGEQLNGPATPPVAPTAPPTPPESPWGGLVYGGTGAPPAPRRFDAEQPGFSFGGISAADLQNLYRRLNPPPPQAPTEIQTFTPNTQYSPGWLEQMQEAYGTNR